MLTLPIIAITPSAPVSGFAGCKTTATNPRSANMDVGSIKSRCLACSIVIFPFSSSAAITSWNDKSFVRDSIASGLICSLLIKSESDMIPVIITPTPASSPSVTQLYLIGTILDCPPDTTSRNDGSSIDRSVATRSSEVSEISPLMFIGDAPPNTLDTTCINSSPTPLAQRRPTFPLGLMTVSLIILLRSEASW